MLIPIRKRTLENLVDEVGELQADMNALEGKLKKMKAELKKTMHEMNVVNVQGRRFQSTHVIRKSVTTNWGAIVDALNIAPEIVSAYSRTRVSEYPLVKLRKDVK